MAKFLLIEKRLAAPQNANITTCISKRNAYWDPENRKKSDMGAKAASKIALSATPESKIVNVCVNFIFEPSSSPRKCRVGRHIARVRKNRQKTLIDEDRACSGEWNKPIVKPYMADPTIE